MNPNVAKALVIMAALGADLGMLGKPDRKCPKCDEPVSADARSCPHCGEALEQGKEGG